MILYIKEDQYCWGDDFFVLDENNQRKYHVTTGTVLWNRKFEIRDLNKNVLATIKNEPKSPVKKKFYVFIGDKKVASITKEISLIPKFTIEGLDWKMRGVMLHEYEMLSGGQEVLSFHRTNTRWGQLPTLKINDPANELLALAVVMAISYAYNAGEDGQSTTHL